MNNKQGIDYGRGLANIDNETGIRFGIISQHSLADYFVYEDFEAEYGDPTCPKCELVFGNDEAYSDEPIAHILKDSDYFAHYDNSGFGVWCEKSEYYTYAEFCSPCAPGAGDLDSPINPDELPIDQLLAGYFRKVYCFGHECFESGKAPYRVFLVADNSEVTA